jgi:hypothetical protein
MSDVHFVVVSISDTNRRWYLAQDNRWFCRPTVKSVLKFPTLKAAQAESLKHKRANCILRYSPSGVTELTKPQRS